MASASSISGRTSSTTITAEVTRLARDHAAEAAREGAELARGLGATAEPISIIDEANVAVAIAAQADREDVPVIVVGSRGLGRVKAPLLGSTSQGLLRRTERPCSWSERSSRSAAIGANAVTAPLWRAASGDRRAERAFSSPHPRSRPLVDAPEGRVCTARSAGAPSVHAGPVRR
jgi:hypothetical protein